MNHEFHSSETESEEREGGREWQCLLRLSRWLTSPHTPEGIHGAGESVKPSLAKIHGLGSAPGLANRSWRDAALRDEPGDLDWRL